MAILFKRVKRALVPNDKASEIRVFPVITYKYNVPATIEEIGKEIGMTSGASEGEAIGVLKDFRTLLRKILLQGRIVNIKGLGVFYLSLQGKGCPSDEEFDSSCISGLRICFRANKDIRLIAGTATRTDGLNFKDVDRINQAGGGAPVTPEEPGGDDGGGEAPDPTV